MAARLAACLEQAMSAGPGYEGDRKIVLARMLRRSLARYFSEVAILGPIRVAPESDKENRDSLGPFSLLHCRFPCDTPAS
jgi:hypothetical protein